MEVMIIIFITVVAIVAIRGTREQRTKRESFHRAVKDITDVYVTTGRNILKIAATSNFEDNPACQVKIMAELTSMAAAMRDAYGIGYISISLAAMYVRALEEKNHPYIRAAHLYIIKELRKDNSNDHYFNVIEGFILKVAPTLLIMPPKIEDNMSEGVFQIKKFPYTSYEEWLDAYRNAAGQANDVLEIKKGDNGKDWSLVDLMDDTPLRSAYRHHLNPVSLGEHFGKVFNIDEVQFKDGMKTGDFLRGKFPELYSQEERDALVGEAIRCVLESGATSKHAEMAGMAMGKWYDKKEAKGKV